MCCYEENDSRIHCRLVGLSIYWHQVLPLRNARVLENNLIESLANRDGRRQDIGMAVKSTAARVSGFLLICMLPVGDGEEMELSDPNPI